MCVIFYKVDNLKICTFNCTSLEEVKELCDQNDIVLLQEIWFSERDLYILNQLHCDYYGRGVSAFSTEDGVLTGRPHGGIAILWRKLLSNVCNVVTYDDPRIMGLEVNESSSRQLLILNVYMPYNNLEHMDLFQYYLQVINNIIVDFPSPYSYVIGDFNSNLIDPNNK